MTYYVQVEDCQNNIKAVVKVDARSEDDARYKALKALHINESLYIVSKEDAVQTIEDEGIYAIDEDGCEIDLEEDE